MSVEQDSLSVEKVIPYAPIFAKKSEEKTNTSDKSYSINRPMQEGRVRKIINYDLVLSSVFILSVFLLLVIRKTVGLQSFYQDYFKKDIKKMGVFQMIGNIIPLYIFSFLVISGFFYLLVGAEREMSGFLAFFYVSIGFLAFLLVKVSLILFTGYFFENEKAGLIYLEANLSSYKLVSLLLVPVIFISLVFPHATQLFVISLGIIMLGLMVLVQIFYGMKILLLYNFSKFHTILYLCTLEIVPLLYTIIVIKECI